MGRGGRRARLRGWQRGDPASIPFIRATGSKPLLLSPWVPGSPQTSEMLPNPLSNITRGSRAGLAPAASAVVSQPRLLHRFQVKPPHRQCRVTELLCFLVR